MTEIPLAYRPYFSAIHRIAFGNPFEKHTHELEAELAESPLNTPGPEVRAILAGRLRVMLRDMEAKQSLRISDYRAEDREVITSVLLYDLLMEFIPQLDATIEKQSVTEGLIRCSFAKDLLGRLTQMGYSNAEALKRFAILYQLRRAYYFVDRGLVGRSPCMMDLRRRIWNNIFTSDIRWYVTYLWRRMEDYSLLLLGGTGTGKSAAAAAIGCSGFIPFDEKKGCFAESFNGAFTEINLSQYPETLIESELFGHRKGAFTGAIDNHEGLLSRCSPFGSIFLDEIGDVSIPVQIKLLRVLQERKFYPVGSHDESRFQGRVIAATNHNLSELRAEKRFRDDFYYRLSSDCIELPSLAQRLAEAPEELALMVGHLLQRMTGRQDKTLEGDVLELLGRQLPARYTWPGNVRELEQALRRILLTREYTGDPYIPQAEGAVMQRGPVSLEKLQALYAEHQNYSSVGKLVGLDRRTVKKYLDASE